MSEDLKANWKYKHDWRDKLILIVEDVEANHMFISAALRKTGVQQMWAKDGLQAVDMARLNPNIDLILMDIRLPELNGYDATRQIKAFRPDIPIIAQTAYVMSNEKADVLQAGCDDLITKPIKLNVLLETCAKFLEA